MMYASCVGSNCGNMAGQRDSKRQERRLAVALDGTRNAASGALPFRKADIRSKHYLVEAKITDKRSYSIKLKDWETLRRLASLEGRTPMYAVQLGKRRLIIVEEDDFPFPE